MVPRPDVVAFSEETPVGELIPLVVEGKHSRYPVYENDSPDRIIGAVHVKDVLRAFSSETKDSIKTAHDLARDVLTIPENRHIDDILEDLRKASYSATSAGCPRRGTRSASKVTSSA